jgi:hypothetical protein
MFVIVAWRSGKFADHDRSAERNPMIQCMFLTPSDFERELLECRRNPKERRVKVRPGELSRLLRTMPGASPARRELFTPLRCRRRLLKAERPAAARVHGYHGAADVAAVVSIPWSSGRSEARTSSTAPALAPSLPRWLPLPCFSGVLLAGAGLVLAVWWALKDLQPCYVMAALVYAMPLAAWMMTGSSRGLGESSAWSRA